MLLEHHYGYSSINMEYYVAIRFVECVFPDLERNNIVATFTSCLLDLRSSYLRFKDPFTSPSACIGGVPFNVDFLP